jgi:hypothetical protein
MLEFLKCSALGVNYHNWSLGIILGAFVIFLIMKWTRVPISVGLDEVASFCCVCVSLIKYIYVSINRVIYDPHN